MYGAGVWTQDSALEVRRVPNLGSKSCPDQTHCAQTVRVQDANQAKTSSSFGNALPMFSACCVLAWYGAVRKKWLITQWSGLRRRLTVGQAGVPDWTDLGRAYVPAVGSYHRGTPLRDRMTDVGSSIDRKSVV